MRHSKSVYGKSRHQKQSDLLWIDAITESLAEAANRVHNIAEVSPIKVKVERKTTKTPAQNDLRPKAVLRSLNPNTSPEKVAYSAKHKVRKPRLSEENLVVEIGFEDSFLEPIAIGSPEIHRHDSSQSFTVPEQGTLPSQVTRKADTIETFEINAAQTKESGKVDLAPARDEMTGNIGEIDSIDTKAADTMSMKALEQALTDVQLSVQQPLPLLLPPTIGLDVLLKLCDQLRPTSFAAFIEDLTVRSSLLKLGEASYSEVFLETCKSRAEQTVLKIIPFGPAAAQIPVRDIVQELRISKTMSRTAGFVGFKGACVVRGTYPKKLLQDWDDWACIHTAESDRPDWYQEDQMYCIIRLEHGGIDLEHADIKTWTEAAEVFVDIATTLASGEHNNGFEHRDLHWGNVLVSPPVPVTENSTEIVPRRSKITIIDYTLSRTLCDDDLSRTAHYDFSDQAIFEGDGSDYQFDIYRLMRDKTTDWADFTPITNVLWLHYLVDKILYFKGLKKPASRRSKRCSVGKTEVASQAEREAWGFLESIWREINPKSKKFRDMPPVSSAKELLAWMET